jgi:LmbE family N-acetylglucosaminyl deacetylase
VSGIASRIRILVLDRIKLLVSAIRGSRSARDVTGEIVPPLRGWSRRPRLSIRHEGAAPVVIVSPHLDDAVLSCWSELTSDRDVLVANVFAGLPPPGSLSYWDRLTGASDSTARMEERLKEDESALALAGCRSVNLGFLETEFRRRSPSIAALVSALAEHVPTAARVWIPAGIGGHTDHLIVREMSGVIASYGVPVDLYAELPYSFLHGWPAWVTGSAPNPYLSVDAYWERYLSAGGRAQTALTPEVRELDQHQAAAKLEAIRAYRTQYPALAGGERETLADPLVLRYEVIWRTERGG